MKALKVRSRDLCRMAGGAGYLELAVGRTYQAVRDASKKGLLITEDGELYVRYGQLTVPPEVTARRLKLIAGHIAETYQGRGVADPVVAAQRSGVAVLTSTCRVTDRQYVRLVLGMREDHPALDVGAPCDVVRALLAEAATCQS